MTAVDVKNLTKSYGDLVAVNDVSFEVREGEIFALLGPNGAGKSTTIKVIMGLLDADSGSAEVFSISSKEDPIGVKRVVGYVPEDVQLYDSLTPRELFNFIASIRELDDERMSKRISEMVRALDFEKYYDTLIATLSQWNKQKTMLIAAMMHAPKLLILDEPFSGLDVRTTKIMKDVIKIHVENSGAVLLSTHIMEVAEGLVDRVAIIDDGILVGMGTLAELRSQSQDESETLENIFLRLTDEEQDVTIGVDTLRRALSD
ncbi:MAG: ABC transporter ATP-binding protein [Candidatus Thorarchaeota archaeon]